MTRLNATSAKPLVSILINNYNYGRFLSCAIDSALAQEWQNVEVIVVDDGSTDDSREIMRSYGQRIKAVVKENGGQASAFNAGFAASRGEIICLLDSDDVFYPGKVTRVMELYQQHPDIGWLFHPLDYIAGDGTDYGATQRYGVHGSCKLSLREQMIDEGNLTFDPPATTGLTFRRSTLGRILPMPEAEGVVLSDHYIKYMAFLSANGFFLDEMLAKLNIHDSNLYTLRQDSKAVKLGVRITVHTAYWVKKNYPDAARFTAKLMAFGIYRLEPSHDMEKETLTLISEYLSSLSRWNRFLTLVKIIIKKWIACGNRWHGAPAVLLWPRTYCRMLSWFKDGNGCCR